MTDVQPPAQAADAQAVERLASRVKLLEGSMKGLRWIIPGIMILAAAGFATSLGFNPRLLKPDAMDAKTVVAETLALRNANGDIVARLGTTPDGAPGIVFFDKDRNPRLVVGLRADGGPSVSLVDPQQAPRAVLSLNDKQEPALTLFNAAKLPRAVVSVDGLEMYSGRPR